MSSLIGNILVLTILAVAVALAVRSMWRTHKSGGHCGGDCGSCGGCGGCQNR
nr:FeoB-associated Cys-rich membrane protein [uncultured Dysosmobacter sp.]